MTQLGVHFPLVIIGAQNRLVITGKTSEKTRLSSDQMGIIFCLFASLKQVSKKRLNILTSYLNEGR